MTEAFGPGTVIAEKYEIVRLLGHGGMAEVFEALHLGLDQRVAVKVMTPEPQGGTRGSRFFREARAVAKLRTEHAVRVLDVDRLPSGTPYMVMELLDGEDLATLARRRPLGVVEAVDFVLEACAAMVSAHALGIIHRDLKPQNLFLARVEGGKTSVKVVDFGLAKEVDRPGQLTKGSVLLGTPSYMSPEQIGAPHDVDERSDIWSLAATLFALLAGRPPFQGSSLEDQIANVTLVAAPRIRALRPSVPVALDEAIDRALEKRPNDRFPTMQLFADALRASVRDLRNRTESMDGEATIDERDGTLESTRDVSPELVAKRFRVLERIGSGGMGDVWRAHDQVLEREVALKIMRGHGRDQHRRVLREARAAAALAHPNVVTVYDVEEDFERVIIAMELVEGTPLRAVMQKGVDRENAMRWMQESAAALEAAHAKGLVHRDVKPDNMLVCKNGSVKLLDFGIATRQGHSPDDAAPESQARMGTPRYMAPEQQAGAPTDARTDQFGWALTAMELLGVDVDGRRITMAPTDDAAREIVERWLGSVEELPPLLAAAIEKAARRSAADRHTSFRDIVRAFDKKPVPASTKRIVIGATIALFAAGIAFVLWNAHVHRAPFVCTANAPEEIPVDTPDRLGLGAEGNVLVVELSKDPHLSVQTKDGWARREIPMLVKMGGEPWDAVSIRGTRMGNAPALAWLRTDWHSALVVQSMEGDEQLEQMVADNVGVDIVTTGAFPAMVVAEKKRLYVSDSRGTEALIERAQASSITAASGEDTIAVTYVTDGLRIAWLNLALKLQGTPRAVAPTKSRAAIALDANGTTVFWREGTDLVATAFRKTGAAAPPSFRPAPGARLVIDPVAMQLADHRAAVAWAEQAGSEVLVRFAVLRADGSLWPPLDVVRVPSVVELLGGGATNGARIVVRSAPTAARAVNVGCSPR